LDYDLSLASNLKGHASLIESLHAASPNLIEVFPELLPTSFMETYPGVWMPFPYRFVAANGVGLSIIIWMLYRYRRRFVEVLSTLWKRDVVEQGLSLRLVTVLMLIGFFGWYALMLAEQASQS
ncbi:MAG: hypothetical protein QXG57_05005, partial [Thermofilaceae archaeon]